MNIQVRFFASLREALGTAQETLAVPEQVKTVGEVRHFLQKRGSPWAEALAEGKAIRMAYNQQMASAATLIAEGGEVAFFPPVTGG